MKKVYFLDQKPELDFDVFAINSHCKSYALCWHINNETNTCFEKSSGVFFSEKEVYSQLIVNTKVMKCQLFKINQNGDF